MFSANQIAVFLNFNISKTIRGIKLVFACKDLSFKLQIDDVIVGGHGQACPPKEAIKT